MLEEDPGDELVRAWLGNGIGDAMGSKVGELLVDALDRTLGKLLSARIKLDGEGVPEAVWFVELGDKLSKLETEGVGETLGEGGGGSERGLQVGIRVGGLHWHESV